MFITDPIVRLLSQIANMRLQTLALMVLNVLLVGTSALMTWNTMKVFCNNSLPIVVVLTGSMEPSYSRGDLLLVMNSNSRPIEMGDVVVYQVTGKPIPIVHRVLRKFSISTSDRTEERYLTKGDANKIFDNSLYTDRSVLTRDNIYGRIAGYFPGLGYATITLKERPIVKYALFALVGMSAMLGHEG